MGELKLWIVESNYSDCADFQKNMMVQVAMDIPGFFSQGNE
jgi:hypothetical protein